MFVNKIFWTGISTDERLKAMSEITEVIDHFGIILNFQRFSDVSLSYLVEIETDQLNNLYCDLKNILFMEGFDQSAIDLRKASILFLNITFTQSTGDLEIEVPDIPD